MVRRRSLSALIVVIASLSTVIGCNSAPGQPNSIAIAPPTASLLFNRYQVQGTPPPSLWADRPQWPSAPGIVPAGEALYYHERIVDFQGPRHVGHHDPTYRRFTVHREGVAYR